jgi:Domain of unknown function(DUF2779)
MVLSKSDYLLYLKHPAWLWLKKHDKDKLPPIDDNTQAIFDAGNLFEAYAEQLFPSGIRLGFTDYASYLALPGQTMEAILGGVKILFQARFEAGPLTCICDVIEFVGEKDLNLYEIKSSTDAKPEHIVDLAFQAQVLRECGFTVRNISVVHVNNSYVRSGDIISKDFCSITDVTDKVTNAQVITRQHIDDALRVIQLPDMPDPSPAFVGNGSFGDWLPIFTEITNQPKGSIYELCAINADKVRELEEQNIKMLVDIPDDFPLTPKQNQQHTAAKLNQQLIEQEPIRSLLSTYTFPLYFLDYETFAAVVPAFDGLRPYQQVPFQYSLHILDSPDSPLRHEEYLHRECSNPCSSLAEALRSHIGEHGTILVWNESFEKSCNKTLAHEVPDLEDFLLNLNERIRDLKIPFSKGWYVDKDFCGSASIKKVLPVLVPSLSYASLGIHEGGSAQRLWTQAVIDGKDTINKEVMFADLIAYCKLDTLAMVEIFNVLRKL